MYVPIDVDILDHPKLFDLSIYLNCTHLQAFVHLFSLWAWAMKYCEDGDLSNCTDAHLRNAAKWTDNGVSIKDALEDSGWLVDGKLHAWDRWAGKTLKSLEKDRRRKQEERDKKGTSKKRPRTVHGTSTPDKEKDKEKEKDKDRDKEKKIYGAQAQEVIDYLNEVCQTSFKGLDSEKESIVGRLKEGYTVDECKMVVLGQSQDEYFITNPKYFRPMTLFGKKKFSGYLNAAKQARKKGKLSTAGLRTLINIKNVMEDMADGEEENNP